jgi:hypothetical protein
MGVQPLSWVYVYGRIFWAKPPARIAQSDLAGSDALDEITRIEGERMTDPEHKRLADENAALKREIEKMRELLNQLRSWMERIEDDGR